MIYKIYGGHGDGFRHAFFETSDAKVIAASPSIRFMLGWDYEKVRRRADERGFTIVLKHGNFKRPPSLDAPMPAFTERKPTTRELAQRTDSSRLPVLLNKDWP